MDSGETKFNISRKLFEHELWISKPSSWKIIWIYILGNVNHSDNKFFKRGEGHFNFAQLIQDRRLGEDVTIDMVKGFLAYARKMSFLTTTRTTRGTVLKVLKYHENQAFDTKSNPTSNPTETRRKPDANPSISNNVKNVKNEKNDIISSKSEKKSEKPEETGVAKQRAPRKLNDVAKLFEVFYRTVNPTINYANMTSRKSAALLIKKFGIEKTLKLAEYAVSIQGEEFAPTISTPHQLREKITSVVNHYTKNKSREDIKKNNNLDEIYD